MMCYIANDNNDVGKAHELFNVSLVLIRFASGDSNVKRSLDKHRAARYANNNQIVSDNDELNNQALDLLIKRADDNHTRLTSSFESERTHFGEKFYDAAVSRDYETLGRIAGEDITKYIQTTSDDTLLESFSEYQMAMDHYRELYESSMTHESFKALQPTDVSDINKMLLPTMHHMVRMFKNHEVTSKLDAIEYAAKIHKRKTGEFPGSLEDLALPKNITEGVWDDEPISASVVDGQYYIKSGGRERVIKK